MTASPCVATCRLEGGMCIGCGRTTAEIACWKRLSPSERERITRIARERLLVDEPSWPVTGKERV